MNINTKSDLLDYLVNELPSASEGVTFDYDDFDDGIAYITVGSREFKVSVEEN